jgi:hypothetical protein
MATIALVESTRPRSYSPPEECAVLIQELSNKHQQVDVFCWQLVLLAFSSAFERETVWDVTNRIFDRYLRLTQGEDRTNLG